ncbi:hypothetical protein [Actinoallomurus iriomotensis]|uniref:Uncharacterized protein n=1 Tax=Actinoallomurus iriomotensis TaxID=478107 RepID=A0A9W6RYU5_9ACTN|nr:hypothetical protein [Actinoallomurus iriomotensis]GLY84211.1 hypothetical protein Airi02_021400 [Actinoallomurus iriomotensis]
MDNIWEPVLEPADLWGPEIAGKLGDAIGQRHADVAAAATHKLDQLRSHAKLAVDLTGKLIDAQTGASAREQIQKSIADVAPLSPPASDTLVEGLPLAVLPRANSCVTGNGPYNQWGNTWDPRELTHIVHPAAISTPTPRVLHPRVVAVIDGEQEEIMGSGCWFNVAVSGRATLNVEWFFNAGCDVFTLLAGYGYAFIGMYGSVWGARENRWVDHGGAGLTLADQHYIGIQEWAGQSRRISVGFDAIAGGAYYCAGWLHVHAFAAGLSGARAEIATVLNPLQVCV